jgi:hypothetical protein
VTTAEVATVGICAGVLSNITGYVITGRLFHGYQARTPGTWRVAESWGHYMYSAGIRVLACIGIALLYHSYQAAGSDSGINALSGAIGFAICLWAVAMLPVILEIAIFVNWHRGFVVGLAIDWLVLCAIACSATAVAARVA